MNTLNHYNNMQLFLLKHLHAFQKNSVDQFITHLHKQYKPKSVKRKIASLKAFFQYMEYKELLTVNPFLKFFF